MPLGVFVAFLENSPTLRTTFVTTCDFVILKVIFANSVDPDQTAPLEAIWLGSTLFACMQK